MPRAEPACTEDAINEAVAGDLDWNEKELPDELLPKTRGSLRKTQRGLRQPQRGESETTQQVRAWLLG